MSDRLSWTAPDRIELLLLPVGKAPLRPYGTARRARGTTRRLAPFAIVGSLLVLTGCSSSEVDQWKRGGLVKGITTNSDRVETLWQGAWIACLLVGVLVWGLIFWAMIAFRRRSSDEDLPAQVRYNMPVEITFTAVPLIMILVYFFFTARDESVITKVSNSSDVVVNVVGKRWSWDFNYLTKSAQPDVHTVGTPGQPPVLYVPQGKSVRFILTSRDVNHSFFVPAFQFKLDLIPGRQNEFEVTPTKLGDYRGKCAELCGVDHSRMLFTLRVVTPQDYETYLTSLRSNPANKGSEPATNGPEIQLGAVPGLATKGAGQ